MPRHPKCMIRALVVILSVSNATSAMAERVTMAVAANFLTTARDITAVFEAQTGHQVDLVHGSSGKLFAQISNGAPFDLFLSADAARPARLVQNGAASAENVKPYAIGHLALVHGGEASLGTLEETLSRNDTRVAIADPAFAPYGVAARTVLRRLREGDWEQGIILGESVGQAFTYVATGNAEIGLVALAQIMTYEGSLWVLEVPDSLHDPIQQDAVLLNRGAENQAAAALYDFLSSEFATPILIAAGYEVPE